MPLSASAIPAQDRKNYMETETQRAQKETAGGANPQMCPSCGGALVEGMRFCRLCGYRLGEGMAEFVETVRFDRMATGMPGAAQGEQSLAGAQAYAAVSPVAAVQPPNLSPARRRKSRKEPSPRWWRCQLSADHGPPGRREAAAQQQSVNRQSRRESAPT